MFAGGVSLSTTSTGSPAIASLNVNVTNSPLSVSDAAAEASLSKLAATSSTSSVPAQAAITAISSTVLAANASRKEVTVVNTGTTVIYLGLGQTPTPTSYHVALSACSTANDGTGGTYISDLWVGAVNAICATSGTVCVTELT